ncbi:MAG TPA: hypothetical protein VF702_09685 [Allosphingosinicella sp.]|jgi:hypothetical protein
MRKLILLASATAMAVTMPVLAEAKSGGQGKGGGNPHAAHSGGGGRERGPEARQQRADHGGGRGHGRGGREIGVERGNGQGRVERGRGNERRVAREVERIERRDVHEARRIENRDWSGWLDRSDRRGGRHGFADRSSFFRDGRPLPVRAAAGQGCPPGLAKQNAFCMPPGQLRRAQMLGQRVDRNRFGAVPQEWLYRFRDDDQFYYLFDDDGFVYRVDRDNDLVSSIVPIFSSGLMIGEPLPLGYDVYNVPFAYRDDFVDGDEHFYRYDDNAIYRVDTETRLIEGVVALLSGNPISVGQRLPTGYDVYNLPSAYRGEYTDDADSMYRYADGGIYQVDPTTMLVEALVEMIV